MDARISLDEGESTITESNESQLVNKNTQKEASHTDIKRHQSISSGKVVPRKCGPTKSTYKAVKKIERKAKGKTMIVRNGCCGVVRVSYLNWSYHNLIN